MKTIINTKFVKNTFTLALMLLVTAFSVAQEEEEEKNKFTFGGSIDAYYKANLNAPNDEGVAPLTSFANLDGFALGMANIIASYETGKVGAVADLVFGPRGTDAIFNSPQYSATGDIINQLYAYWNVSDKVTLTIGNFNTFLGYEVISPTGNFNYSTSHLFTNGPFSHTGIKADFALSDDFSLMLAVMNPTDLTEFNPDGKYAFGAQLGYSGQYLNLLLDDAGIGFEVDYTGGFDLSEKFFLGINGAYQTNTFDEVDGEDVTEVTAGFYGVALYPQLAASDSFSIGLRGEYFGGHTDVDNVDTPSVFAATLTGSYSVDNLTIKPEIRLDSWTDSEPFVDSDGDPQDSLSVFYLAAIYSF